MTAKDIFNGSTGNRATFLILDANGVPRTGVAFNASGLSISYRINTGSAVSITLTSGNWFEIGAGKYYVDVADSVYAVGNLGALVQFYGSLTDCGVYGEQHRVVAYNPLAVAMGANTTTPPTAAAIASQTRTELTTELARIDVATSTRLASASYTTPPTAAANADATLSGLTSGPTTGGNWPAGSFGRQILIGSSTQREVAVTGSNHVAADIHELQPAVITSADFATDAISGDAVSSGAVTKIVTGVWSALTSGFGVSGSAGRALARLIGLVQDSGGDRFTAKALEQAPTGSGGGGTVNVLPAVGISAERSAGVVLNPFVGETISQAITLYQTDGTTPINLSGKTLELVFDTRSGTDVAVVDNASITVSGTNSNTITFAYPSAVTASERVLRVALRDASAPKTVYLSGLCKVSLAPFND